MTRSEWFHEGLFTMGSMAIFGSMVGNHWGHDTLGMWIGIGFGLFVFIRKLARARAEGKRS